MRRAVPWILALVVVAAVVASVVAVRRADEADDRRRAAESVAAAERRAEASGAARLVRLETWIAQERGREVRDRAQADRSAQGLDDLAELEQRLEAAQAALADLTVLSDEQRRQIGILRDCVRTLDGVTAALDRGETAAAGLLLEQGRGRCREAEELADGITAAVHPYDFPDPEVIAVGGTYYAYSTNGPAGTIQVLRSTDLHDWQVLGAALDGVPGWAVPGYTWAPGVVRVEGGYALHYTVRHRESGRQCISVATAPAPEGPFHDATAGPLVCQVAEGGSIDPSAYRDEGGTLFLTWKSEGETIGGRSKIWAQPLDPTGTRLVLGPLLLLEQDRGWEGRVAEAPVMARLAGGWVLLYAGNSWNTASYAIGWARCDGPLGPCHKPPGDNVVLRSSSVVAGPGGPDLFRSDDGTLRLAYAGWDPGAVGPPNPRRLYLAVVHAGPDGISFS